MLPDPVFVADQAALEDCVAQSLKTDAIAVDTEFVRTDTFYPLLGLIQISDGEAVWLIDPLAEMDFESLRGLLLNSDVIKVFHSCSEDLEVLRYVLDVVPQPLFDTQIASAFDGYGFSVGYSGLVAAALEIELDKHETRSDWLQRPLSSAQLRYAAEDVYFLIKAYRKLATSLDSSGRIAWVREDMNDLVAQANHPETPESYYLRVKGAWKLNPADLALLRKLTRWREEEARQRDRPRNRVIADKSLLDLIDTKPTMPNGLYGIDGIHKGIIRRYGEQLIDMIHSESDMSELRSLAEPLDKQGRALLSHCKQKLSSKADKLGIAVELLARKKDLEPLVKSALTGDAQLPERLAKGWRFALVGPGLLAYVQTGLNTGE